MDTTLTYVLTAFTNNHINSILAICQQQLGKGFLSRETLTTYLNQTDKFCFVALAGEQVVGFSLMEIAPRDVIASKMKSAQTWFSNHFKAYEQIGYRSLTAVDPTFEGRGVASLLVKEGLAFLGTKVDVVICDAWKSETTHIGNILERNGYEPLKEIPYFWTSESINEQYNCSVCGAPPCSCSAVIYAKFFRKKPPHWWERTDLCYQDNQLHFTQTNISNFIKNKATPLYIYNVDRVVGKFQALEQALQQTKVPFSIYYAMKANRHPAILSHLKIRTQAKIDVCSPNELERALQYGFQEKNISYTGTSLSNQDLAVLAKHPEIKINFDSLSAIRRFAQLDIEREIGIRINPNIGLGYNQSLEYSGNHIVKFGIYKAQWEALKTLLEGTKLTVTTVHCHSGSGFLTPQLERFPYIFDQISAFLQLFPQINTLNMGGGLGVPQAQGDQELNLEQWATLVGKYAQERQLQLAFEPGDYLVKDAGILITEVNTIEEKMGKLFIGLDTGMNMNNEYAYYDMNLEVVPLVDKSAQSKQQATLCGNINEPVDLFAEDKWLPALEEGDYIALINSGGYGASSSSNHCMRGDFKEYILTQQ